MQLKTILMSKKIFKNEELEDFFGSNDPLEVAKNLEGKIYRDYENRKTKQFELGNSSYFIKYHGPVGWKEIFKNLIQFKIPVIGAEREWKSLLKLRSLGIGCPEPQAFMTKGWNPANQESFLVTKDLKGTFSLEDFFVSNSFLDRSVKEKRTLLLNIAKICRLIHENGLNHRDLYLCHFHIEKLSEQFGEKIYLIDLHRGQIRKKVPLRWAIKDIGGLLHSILPFGISEMDCYRFLMVYFDCSFKELMKEKKDFIKRARFRAYSMYMKPLLQEINISREGPLNKDSIYRKCKGKNFRWIGKKDLLSKEIEEALGDLDKVMLSGNIIKKESGHFIVSISLGGKEFFIKKYQIKNKIHYLRKFFSKSRAKVSWVAIHWLRAVNIRTAEPVVLYECFNSFSVTDSYLITEKIEGEILSEACKKDKKYLIIVSKIQALFKRLRWIGFNHGDAKTSNFFLDEDKLVVFDLDGSKKQVIEYVRNRKINKDIKRMLRSVKENSTLHSLLIRRLGRS